MVEFAREVLKLVGYGLLYYFIICAGVLFVINAVEWNY